MAITNISYSNTFFQWVNATNELVNKVNLIDEGNYTKLTGTLTLSSPGTSLVVANAASFYSTTTFSSNVNVTGTSSLRTTNFASGTITIANTSNLNVYSNTFFEEFVTSNNYISIRNAQANGIITFSNTANVIYNSNTIFNTDTVLKANNTVSGNVNVTGTLYVPGTVNISGPSTISGNVSLTSNISGTIVYTSNSNTTFNGNTTFVGDSNFRNANVSNLLIANNLTVLANTRLIGTGYIKLPVGTTSQRPYPEQGFVRFNSELIQFEGYNGTGWGTIGGGATGGVGNAVFYENDQTVTSNYTITTGKNAMSAGPITIANTVTVTIPSGSVWTIV